MKHSIVAIVAMGLLLLTGCSGKGEFWRQAQGLENRFIESEEEKREVLKQLQEQNPVQNGVYSEVVSKELLELEKVLKEIEKQGILTASDEWYEEEEEYIKGDPLELSEACELLRSGEGKEEFSYGSDIYGDFETAKKEDMETALELLEEKGYEGLHSLLDTASEESNGDNEKAIRGIFFSVMRDLDAPYVLEVRVPSRQLYCEKSIADYMKSNVDGSFSLDSCITGGYIERLQLLSNTRQQEEKFSSAIVTDIRNGKAISFQALITANQKKAVGKVFSEEQQPTLIRILTQVTGNEKEASEFVKNLEIKADQKGNPVVGVRFGSIGDKTYTWERERTYDENIFQYTLYIE